jgi:hypothetical protein
MRKEKQENQKALTLTVLEENGGLSVKTEVNGFTPLEIVGILQLQINDLLNGLNAKHNRETMPFPNGNNFEA